MPYAATQPQTQPGPQPVLAQAAPIEVQRSDLPLSCPRPQDTLWNMHPRVYLPIEDEPDHQSVCPYCGAHYRLAD